MKKVTRVSKYGFQVDDKDKWLNWDKSIKDKPEVKIGDAIEYIPNEKGYIIEVLHNNKKEEVEEPVLDDKPKHRVAGQIIKQECLNSAINTLQFMDKAIYQKDPVVTAVEIAKVFENYINGK